MLLKVVACLPSKMASLQVSFQWYNTPFKTPHSYTMQRVRKIGVKKWRVGAPMHIAAPILPWPNMIWPPKSPRHLGKYKWSSSSAVTSVQAQIKTLQCIIKYMCNVQVNILQRYVRMTEVGIKNVVSLNPLTTWAITSSMWKDAICPMKLSRPLFFWGSCAFYVWRLSTVLHDLFRFLNGVITRHIFIYNDQEDLSL